MRICRISDVEEETDLEMKYDDECSVIESWIKSYYSLHPDLDTLDIRINKIGDEFVWKLVWYGNPAVFFTFDRLPERLEKFLKEKCPFISDKPS